MKVNPVVEGFGEYAIGALAEHARRLRAEGVRVLDFSIGDPREPTPPFIPEALKAAVPQISQYPTTAGLPELREAIAGYLKRRFGVGVNPDTQVIPTSGSKEAIFSTALAFVDRSRKHLVAWPSPGYPIYGRGARFAGAEGRPVELESDFIFRAHHLEADAWRRAALVWTCSPHNPAGSITSGDDLAALVTAAREGEALLCSDECYADIYDEQPPTSVLEVAGPGAEGVLAFFSLSKRSGMTGYRSGAIVGDAEAIRLIRLLRTSTGTASPEFVQRAAIAAWSDDDHVAERRAIFRQKRRILGAACEAVGMAVVGSEGGIYLWVRVGDDLEISSRLLTRGVLVTPGRAFGEGGEGYVRLALVPPLDQCDEAAEVLRECLAN
ncbi:MAG TPA: aminotransferase class I/II-fold pyridoxal phosphate-dependent enzyme [Acidimicrobiia bacterium]|nr:aminotransferase class I/II-fold pyridoxal phosphate-dependent enzyme [Acidimicrobiia bacterium]